MSDATTNTKKKITENAEEISDLAKSKAMNAAEDAKARVADRADAEAANIRAAGAAFGDNVIAQEAANHLADNLSHAAHAVRDADFAQIQSELTRFARTNPLMFFGGAAVLGFAAARAMKATSQDTAPFATTRDPYYPASDGWS